MNEEIQHVVALPAHLQTSFHPIQLGGLEELRRLQLPEQVLLRHGFLWPGPQFIKDKALEQLLIRDADFDGLIWRAMFEIPVLDQRDVLCTSHAA